MQKFLLSFFLICQISGYVEALPIIPGLLGYGCETPAGSGPNRSGGQIIRVTNLNSKGPGSLRHAVNRPGPRIVVFGVSGYIDITLDGQITVREPYLTIAGQTAPSPGISIKGNGLSIQTHDVLVQHIRTRVGDDPAGEKGSQRDGLEIADHPQGIGNTYNVVVDHVSVGWGLDENMSVIQGAKNITIANSINSEALDSPLHPKDGHSYALLYGGSVNRVSVLRNLFAHNMGRNPRGGGNQDTVFANNVVYHWGAQSSSYGGGGGSVMASIIGNVFIRGPKTTRPEAFRLHPDKNQKFKFYLHDNLTADTPNPTVSDPWDNMKIQSKAISKSEARVEAPPSPLPENLIFEDSFTVKSSVLTNVGARPADRDAVDARIIESVRNGTGKFLVSQDNVDGWPALAENNRIVEIPGSPWKILPSGYNRIEEWLHRLAKDVEN